MARKTKIYDNLSEEDKRELKSIVEIALSNQIMLGEKIVIDEAAHNDYLLAEEKENVWDGMDYIIKSDMISALIEIMYNVKQEAKAIETNLIKFKKSKEPKVEDSLLKDSIKIGDVVTFSITAGKTKKEYEREIVKITDKGFQVEFDENYPCDITPNKMIGRKRIRFSSIISKNNSYETFVSEENESENEAVA